MSLYNICYKQTDISNYRKCLFGLTREQLDKFVDNYNQGTSQIFFRGGHKDISNIIEIQIFDTSKVNSKLSSDEIEARFDEMNGMHLFSLGGHHYISILREFGREITDELIHGEWGYLKGNSFPPITLLSIAEEFIEENSPIKPNRYHIYIQVKKNDVKPQYHICVPQSEVKILETAYAQGKIKFIINGTDTTLEDFHQIKIFKIPNLLQRKSDEQIRSLMNRKADNSNNGKLNLSILREFGEEVTTEYIKGDFGYALQSITDANKTKTDITTYIIREQLNKMINDNSKSFVEESISCYENKNFRAATVLSWVGAVSMLYDHVYTNRLIDFNNEARRRDAKSKDVKTKDDFAKIKEYEFLQIIHALNLIGKNVKDELEVCLKLRNGCGHPNSLIIGENRVLAHIEILLLNVYCKF
ncbi:MAG: hypothetical protein ABIQ40_18920 [Bacteroidia bacterium]